MHTISFLNQKGGTGKTTSVVSLADIWARDHDVLVLDFDPQSSLSRWVDEPDSLCSEYLCDDLEASEVAVGTDWGFDLVPADRSLALFDAKEGLMAEVDAIEDNVMERVLNKLRRLISVAETVYDYLLIDPPPSTGKLSIGTIGPSDSIISPVEPGQGAVDGLTDTINLIDKLQVTPQDGRFKGAFACMIDLRTTNDSETPNLLKNALKEKAFDAFIRRTVDVREAENEGIPLPSYAPDSTATEDYESLAQEIETKL